MDGDHRAARGQRLHQPSTCPQQTRGVIQVKHAGDARGGVFAGAETQERVGFDAPRSPHLCERVFQGEERRLGMLGLEQRLGYRAGLRFTQKTRQRMLDVRIEQARTLVECLTKRWIGEVQLAAHAHVLGALTCKEKGNPWALRSWDRPRGRHRGGRWGRHWLPNVVIQALAQLRGGCRRQRRAHRELRAAGIGGETHIRQI